MQGRSSLAPASPVHKLARSRQGDSSGYSHFESEDWLLPRETP